MSEKGDCAFAPAANPRERMAVASANLGEIRKGVDASQNDERGLAMGQRNRKDRVEAVGHFCFIEQNDLEDIAHSSDCVYHMYGRGRTCRLFAVSTSLHCPHRGKTSRLKKKNRSFPGVEYPLIRHGADCLVRVRL